MLLLLCGRSQVAVQKLSAPNVSGTECHYVIACLPKSDIFHEARIMTFSENLVYGLGLFFRCFFPQIQGLDSFNIKKIENLSLLYLRKSDPIEDPQMNGLI